MENIEKFIIESDKRFYTHSSLPSAGPPFRTSLTAMDGSPFAKCGLSRPPDYIHTHTLKKDEKNFIIYEGNDDMKGTTYHSNSKSIACNSI